MNKRLTQFTLIGFILGIVGGVFIPTIMLNISFLGDIYVNLLKMLMIPVLFFGIVSALCQENTDKTSKVTIYSIILFIIMFLLTFLLNSSLVVLIQPGASANFPIIEWNGTITSLSIKDFFLSIFPSNIIAAAANNSILPVILFAFCFGWLLSKSKDASYLPKCFILGCNVVLNKMLQYVIYLTPIGAFALIGNTVATFGIEVIKNAFIYIGTAWLGSIIILTIIMILPVWIYCKINPIEYVKKIGKIWLMTLSTCSSAATLPETIKVCNDELNIPKAITNITVPLGCTIHMCGGAVSFSLLALFSCQMYNITITPMMFIMMIFSALIINMGAPGIPGGGIVIGATYLTLLGIPIEFIGFYAGIYKLLDMAYTTLNVTGDITANCIIDKALN